MFALKVQTWPQFNIIVMPWTTTDEFNVIPKAQRMSLASFPGHLWFKANIGRLEWWPWKTQGWLWSHIVYCLLCRLVLVTFNMRTCDMDLPSYPVDAAFLAINGMHPAAPDVIWHFLSGKLDDDPRRPWSISFLTFCRCLLALFVIWIRVGLIW